MAADCPHAIQRPWVQAAWALVAVALACSAAACSGSRPSGAADAAYSSAAAGPSAAQPGDSGAAAAPPAAQTGGFDGTRAWKYLETIVGFGPRPPASANIHREQKYLASQLRSFGCHVSTDEFHAQTGVGPLAMENIVAEIPGKNPGIILLLSHYDTVRLAGFVGANDGGSSTAILLEIAHDLCGRPGPLGVWIAFLDGEEEQTNFTSEYQAQTTWTANNNTYGSRELAARMDLSGDLKNVKALMLSDMDGDSDLHIMRDSTSTPWLENLVWSVANRLGYSRYFLSSPMSVTDDHTPFLQKGVPAVDLIGNIGPITPEASFGIYWHTLQDNLEHCSAHSLAVTGHVFLATIQALDDKFAPAHHR